MNNSSPIARSEHGKAKRVGQLAAVVGAGGGAAGGLGQRDVDVSVAERLDGHGPVLVAALLFALGFLDVTAVYGEGDVPGSACIRP